MSTEIHPKRVLIKISGESLKVASNSDIYDKSTIFMLVKQIKVLKQKNYEIAIVVGGGNIWRGKLAPTLDLDGETSDYMGMTATIINAICLRKIFKQHGLDSEIYSSLFMPSLTKYLNYEDINRDIENQILIFAAGTGAPNFTTDTNASLRAMELHCAMMLIGKNGVDGVYDKDPNIYSDAKFYSHLTYQEIIDQNLKVMDLTSLTLCQQRNLEMRVFDINKPNAIIDTLTNIGKFTTIKD